MDQIRISAGGGNEIPLVSNASMITSKFWDSTGEQCFSDISWWIQLSDPTRDFVTPFSHSSGKVAPVNASLLLGYIWEQHLIPSSSFGMHLGVANFGPSLPLWLRGYDGSRIVGPMSFQISKGWDPYFDLLDIGIGSDHGASPFSFVSRAGILAEGNSSMSSSLPLLIHPNATYLDAPNSTCAAIAKNLRVTYNSKYGLYFWSVNATRCKRIVRSPSYLSFTFRAAGLDTANITIKYRLGRRPGKSYLAQAPGPNTALSPNW